MTYDCQNCGHSGLTLDKACPRCNSARHITDRVPKPAPAAVETLVGEIADLSVTPTPE